MTDTGCSFGAHVVAFKCRLYIYADHKLVPKPCQCQRPQQEKKECKPSQKKETAHQDVRMEGQAVRVCGDTDCKVDSRIASCVKSPLVTLEHRGIIQPGPSRPAEPISSYRGGGLKAPCGLTSSMPSMADYSVELCRDFEIEESKFSKGQIQLIHR